MIHGGANPARGAETAAFMGEEADEIRRPAWSIFATLIEDHEGTRRRHIFVGDAMAKFVIGEAVPGSARDLHRLGVGGTGIGQYLGDGHAERVLVDAQPCPRLRIRKAAWSRKTWPYRWP